MKISKALLKALREDMDQALKTVAIKYGLESLTTGSCSFDETEATFKVTAKCKVSVATKVAKNVLEMQMVGLQESDLNREVEIQGAMFKIVGANTRSRKNCVEIERVSDGKSFRCPLSSVR
jgi:hypothetical protein